MAAIIQLNSIESATPVYITKDLVFGWCVKTIGTWHPLSDVDNEWLKAVVKISFPAWVPEDFKAAVQNEIDRSKELADLDLSETKTAKTEQPTANTANLRLRDAIRLLLDMVTHTGPYIKGTVPWFEGINLPLDMTFQFNGSRIILCYLPGTDTEENLKMVRNQLLAFIAKHYEVISTSYATVTYGALPVDNGGIARGYTVDSVSPRKQLRFFETADCSLESKTKALKATVKYILRRFW